MKKLLVSLMMFSSTALGMTSMPEGVYQGTGFWNDDMGHSGEYSVTTSIAEKTLSMSYEFNDQQKKYEFRADIDENGFFAVIMEEEQVGRGYCMRAQCHYRMEFGPTQIEETLTFHKDHLYRIGSKTSTGYRVIWEESMKKRID